MGRAGECDVIANRKVVNRDFGIWNVSCEEDEMFENIRCIMFVEITEKTIVFVNPYNKIPVLIVSRDSYPNRNIFVKVDNNKLLVSGSTADEKYGIVSFSDRDAMAMFNQISSGNNFYMRFAMRKSSFPEGFKEITVKFPLSEFKRAFTYYEEQVSKYPVNNSR
jgi:hypothetical protein